jgi:hypothetical protein
MSDLVICVMTTEKCVVSWRRRTGVRIAEKSFAVRVEIACIHRLFLRLVVMQTLWIHVISIRYVANVYQDMIPRLISVWKRDSNVQNVRWRMLPRYPLMGGGWQRPRQVLWIEKNYKRVSCFFFLLPKEENQITAVRKELHESGVDSVL